MTSQKMLLIMKMFQEKRKILSKIFIVEYVTITTKCVQDVETLKRGRNMNIESEKRRPI